MRTFIAYPPLHQATGGTAVLLRMAAHLRQAGHETALVLREPNAAITAATAGAPVLNWEEAAPDRNDIWLTPEGWPGLLLPGLKHRARTVVYVQNWAYLLNSWPPELNLELNPEWSLEPDPKRNSHLAPTRGGTLPIHLLAVSQPVAWHAFLCTGATCEVLRPGIDLERFHPAPDADGLKKGQTVRIAWMPRKNKALAGQIQDIVQARQAGLTRRTSPDHAWPARVEWVPIHHRTPDEVAELLRSCHLFLATGFPEGCPLPPLEAMASGALVVGFGGFGGWDYMRQSWPQGFQPWWPQRSEEETPWGGNGFYAQDADTIAAALAVEYALDLLHRGGPELAAVRAGALATAAAYSL